MLTKTVNKNLANEIAGLFCSGGANPAVCKQTVANRLIQNLTDHIFESSFLPNLDKGRFYIFEIKRMFNAPSGESKTVMEYQLTDVITGEVLHAWEDTAGKMPVYSKVPSMLYEDKLAIVSLNNTFSSTDYRQPRIVHAQYAQPYGIVFVPSTPPGSLPPPGVDPGQGTIQYPSQPSTPGVTVPVETGFDLKSLLIPALILGGGYLVVKKFL